MNVDQITEKIEIYGLSLKLFETDKVSEMLEISEWQGKNLFQLYGEI